MSLASTLPLLKSVGKGYMENKLGQTGLGSGILAAMKPGKPAGTAQNPVTPAAPALPENVTPAAPALTENVTPDIIKLMLAQGGTTYGT